MPQIYQMPLELANRIAAGQVVERPSSVVKELVENAVDAGAKHITVELRSGGVAYIRVTDDGKGILPEDVRTAFLPHATSKIRRVDDLDAISTLGFRGEALAAIAAVSRVDMFTRTEHQNEGIQISMEGGVETGYGETGCPRGTTVVVRDLFYNVPARSKFLKKDTAEGANVENMMEQIAVSRPGIAFRLIKEGRESFSTTGDGKPLSAICACNGRELAGQLLVISGMFGDTRVGGYISPPEVSRASRNQQNFYVNGRCVRSRTLTAALESAYQNKLMSGRYPLCYLDIRTGLSAVDVNVHPSKLEVKFARERDVFSAIYNGAVSALESHGEMQAIKRKAGLPPREDTVTPNQMRMPEPKKPEYILPESFRRSEGRVASPGTKLSYPSQTQTELRPDGERVETVGEFTIHHWQPPETKTPSGEKKAEPVEKKLPEETAAPEKKAPEARNTPISPVSVPRAQPVQAPAEPAPEPETQERLPEAAQTMPEIRVLGEVFHTYIIAEDKDGVWLIDKHAAHEKILYDRLKTRQDGQASQLLLSPQTVRLSPTEAETCLQQKELLHRAGFAVEEFGRGTLLVREAPMYLDLQDIPFVLSDMAGRIASFRGGENELLEELLKSVACKAAIKAGMDSDNQELQKLAETVLGNDSIRNCPHGRPCVTYLSRYQLEKMFKRVL